MSGGGEPAPFVRSVFMVSDNPNARSQTIRLHLFRRTSCNLYPSGTTAPVPLHVPQFYSQTMQSRPFRRAFAATGDKSLSPCVPSESFRADFFIFQAENGEARGRQTVWQVGLTGGGARGVPLHCGFMRAEKVFVPQDVKCRRKLRKLSRISKKPSFEGF